MLTSKITIFSNDNSTKELNGNIFLWNNIVSHNDLSFSHIFIGWDSGHMNENESLWDMDVKDTALRC